MVVGGAGAAAAGRDYFNAVYGKLPARSLALIAIITFVLLARAFRSLLLPVKAVVLNLSRWPPPSA